MPKVPVYASQAAPTTDTGMVSYTRAQKDSRPFIQAALAKGEVAGTAASLISNFIDGRIRSEGNLQADVALAGADAALEGEVSRLSRIADPASVFNDDITNPNNWQGSVADVQSSVTANLSSYANKIFSAKFAAKAAQHRATLRTKIDQRVVDSRLALYETELENHLLSYSNINDFNKFPNANRMLENYAGERADLINTGNQLVREGLMGADALQTKLNEAHIKIAENAMTLFFNEQPNPIAAFKKLKKGGATAQELAALHPNAAFAMHMMRDMPDVAKRLELRQALEEAAYKAADNEEKERKKQDDIQKENLTKMRNSLFEPSMSPTERAKRIQILENNDFLTAADQKAIADLNVDGNRIFRTSEEGDDPDAITALQALKTEGVIVAEDVYPYMSQLTQPKFQEFMNAAGIIKKDQRKDIDNIARNNFRYYAKAGDKIQDYQEAAQASYFNVTLELEEFKNDFLVANDRPPTNSQLRKKIYELIEEEKPKLDAVVKIRLMAVLKKIDQKLYSATDPSIPKLPKINGEQYDIENVLPFLGEVAVSHPAIADKVLNFSSVVRFYIDLLGDR